ncbi:hypothetical protein [Egbenema bharatensis]
MPYKDALQQSIGEKSPHPSPPPVGFFSIEPLNKTAAIVKHRQTRQS